MQLHKSSPTLTFTFDTARFSHVFDVVDLSELVLMTSKVSEYTYERPGLRIVIDPISEMVIFKIRNKEKFRVYPEECVKLFQFAYLHLMSLQSLRPKKVTAVRAA